MRSLFAKILVWFLVTITVTSIALVIAAAMTFSAPRERHLPFSMLTHTQLSETRHAYETGGRDALAATMDRLHDGTETQGMLTDEDGIDLLTGEDRSELVARARRRSWLPLRQQRWYVMDREAGDGRFWYFLLVPRHRWTLWFLRPPYLWVWGLAALLCYALATHLTAPLRRLQQALERFGKGELTARAGSGRADELGQLACTFDRMADRIQTLLTDERRLLLDISHELRSPLARLGVAAELARDPGEREAALEQIQKESERMNALVEELLQVTRIDGEGAAARLEQIRPDKLLADVVDDARIEANARGCRIELEAQPATLEANPELLRRAFENVLRNAIRFAPPDTAVEVKLRQTHGSATITIRDYGPGVPEQALARLFDPFYRVEADRNRTSGGAGLGLAIARRAVELHRGLIRAYNADPGLTVEMEFPATGT